MKVKNVTIIRLSCSTGLICLLITSSSCGLQPNGWPWVSSTRISRQGGSPGIRVTQCWWPICTAAIRNGTGTRSSHQHIPPWGAVVDVVLGEHPRMRSLLLCSHVSIGQRVKPSQGGSAAQWAQGTAHGKVLSCAKGKQCPSI